MKKITQPMLVAVDASIESAEPGKNNWTELREAQTMALLTFDQVASHLYAFDVPEVKGFAIAGEDGTFVWAAANFLDRDQIEVWPASVEEPVAVRYAWANNPVAHVYDRMGLPLTPFRTE